MKLERISALVVGGGTGIGLGIAQALTEEGCRVAIAGRRELVLREAAESRLGKPGILYHTVDVGDRASVHRLFAWAGEALGTIDVLVNAAGFNIKNRSMADMTPEQWDQMITTNATGAYNCMYAALPDMRARGDGIIVNISSVAGRRAVELGGVAYNASKFAMTALSTTVANEEAKHGIRITNIMPGEVDTPILESRPEPVSEQRRAAMLKPEDVGAMVVAVVCLPPRAHVPELVIKPIVQEFT